MSRRKQAVFLLAAALFVAGETFPAEQTASRSFSNLTWNYQGNKLPETYWTPWLSIGPYGLVVHQGVRYKLGVRCSTGTINVKCPVELSFTYDPEKCKPGQTMPVKIKAQTKAVSGSNYTFASSFALYLPTKVQLGTVGITGIPDVLPWFNTSLDVWDLLGFIPKVGDLLSGLKDQIGINHSNKDALPLGGDKKYSDPRTLAQISVAAALSDVQKFNFGKKICDYFPQSAVSLIVKGIKWAMSMSDDALATGFLYETVGDKLSGLANLSLELDPYFKVKGEKLSVVLDYGVPGRMTGTTALAFASNGETKTIDIPIPLFTSAGEKVEIKIKSVAYEFKVFQAAGLKLKVSVVTLLDGDLFDPKLVDFTETSELPQQNNVVEIPAQVSTATSPILNYNIGRGCTSANARWASPAIPLKGTVTVYQGQSQTSFKTVSENGFGISHGVLISGLNPSTQYRFQLSCVDQNGATYPGGELSATTKEANSCQAPQSQDTATLNDGTTVTLFNPTATSTVNSLTVNWATNVPTSTDAQISLTPDFGTYVHASKKQSGAVAVGYFDSQKGDRISETNHSITFPDLSPETTYSYEMISYFYSSSGSVRTTMRHFGTISTQLLPRPIAQINAYLPAAQYGSGSFLNLTGTSVGIRKSGQDTLFKTVNTNNQGQVSDVTLEAGATYIFSIKDHPAYSDTSAELAIPAGSESSYAVNLPLTKRPSSGGYVYDIHGNPIAGATVTVTSPNYFQTTTDTNGHYTFDKINTPGNISLKISKTYYVDKNVTGAVTQYGIFSANNCVLDSATATVNFEVKKGDTPLAGAMITISQYGGSMTDSSGKYVFKPQLPASLSSDGVLNLDIQVQPQASTGLATMTDSVSLSRGAVINMLFRYPPDTQAPFISDIAIQKASDSQINVNFTTDEDSVHWAQLKGSTGANLNEIPWSTAYTKNHALTFMASAISSNNLFSGGTYKINVKAKDRDGNTSESGFKDFTFVESYNPTLQASNITANSARLSWPRYPQSDFGSYDIKIINKKNNTQVYYEKFQVQGMTGATIFKDITTLSGSTDYQASVQVLSASGQSLGEAKSFDFTTLAAPPQINDLKASLTTLGLNQKTTVTAWVIDPDSNVSKIILKRKDQEKPLFEADYSSNSIKFSQEISFSQRGKYEIILIAQDSSRGHAEKSFNLEVKNVTVPLLTISALPSTAIINKDVPAEIVCGNMQEVHSDLGVSVAWGDGQTSQGTIRAAKEKEQKPGEPIVKVSHRYKDAGDYTISIVGVLKDSGVASETTTLQIKADPEPPQMTLSHSQETQNSCSVDFTYAISKGSYSVGAWVLDFGDSSQIAGTGEVKAAKTVRHEYKPSIERGRPSTNKTYTFSTTLTVTDEKGKEFIQIDKGVTGITAGGKSGGTGQTKPGRVTSSIPATGTGLTEDKPDIALRNIEIAPKVISGVAVTVKVTVANLSSRNVEGCKVMLTSDDGLSEERVVSLQAKGKETLEFRWTPRQAGPQFLVAHVDSKDDPRPANNEVKKRVVVGAKTPID